MGPSLRDVLTPDLGAVINSYCCPCYINIRLGEVLFEE